MQSSRLLIVAFVLFGSVAPGISSGLISTVSAESSVPSGRLADGRAFRTDENGYQLMDHIAELEVSNLELRQQLATAEAELAQNRPIPSSKDRLPSESSGEVPNCNELVSSLYLKISRLEAQRGNSNPLPAAQVACDFQSPQNPLWERISTLEQRLEEASKQASVGAQTQCDYESENNPLWEKISTLEQRLKEASKQAPVAAQTQCDYKSENNPLWEEVRSLQLELQQRGQQVASISTSAPRARLDANTRVAPAVEKPTPVRAQVTSRTDQTELTASLKKIEQLVQGRKSAFDRLKQEQNSVTVSLSQLRTASGVSLDTLRSRIASFGPQSSRAEIERELTEIQALLQEDISVIERLLKVKS